MPQLAFITGASGGIGQAIALRLYQAGYDLALVARDADRLNEWVQARGLVQQRCRIYVADVASIDCIVSAATACMANQGLPELVVANAGISVGMDSAVRADLDVMARVFAVNNIGMAATFHAFIAPMVARGSGTLVGIASVNGIRGFPGHGAYCSSKAAVISYCESLRVELRSSGVQVLTISPGYVDTALTRDNPYSMPFLMSADQFAEKFFRAINADARYRVIPWQMAVVAKLLRVLPDALFDRLFANRLR